MDTEGLSRPHTHIEHLTDRREIERRRRRRTWGYLNDDGYFTPVPRNQSRAIKSPTGFTPATEKKKEDRRAKFVSMHKLREKLKKVEVVVMVDRATQTSTDSSTQTDAPFSVDVDASPSLSSQITSQQSNKIPVTSSQSTSKEASTSTSTLGSAVASPTQTPNELAAQNNFMAQEIFSSLNDLEEEIAKLRFKALTIHESMKWMGLEKKKNSRPARPVLLTHSDSAVDYIDTRTKFTPINKTENLSKSLEVLSVPAKSSQSSLSVDSSFRPDRNKFHEIKGSSVFTKPTPVRLDVEKVKRMSKSLPILPPASKKK